MKPKNDDRRRGTPRQARSRATVDAILLAAAQILRDRGEAARSMRSNMAADGVTFPLR